MKNKKTLLIIVSVLILVFLLFFFLRSKKSAVPNSIFLNTIPLLDRNTNQDTNKQEDIIYPPINPAKTNYQKVSSLIADQVSEVEKDKIGEDLPIRIDSFNTGTKINTTINVFSLVTDPPQSVRIEIYGPNYNNAGLLSEDAKAFKASFEEIKKYFKQKKVNLNNLQIIYGNRQYIQDTATLWVKEFNLLSN